MADARAKRATRKRNGWAVRKSIDAGRHLPAISKPRLLDMEQSSCQRDPQLGRGKVRPQKN
jgi:hypothetical protein